MWLVKLTPSAKAREAGAQETILTSHGNETKDLLREKNIAWSVIDKMLEDGLLCRVDIDYKPERMLGTRRIKRMGDLFYQTRDHIICSPGFTERQDAWEWEFPRG